MRLRIIIFSIIALFWMMENPLSVESQKSSTTSGLDFVSNLDSNERIGSNSSSTNLPRNYTADEINNIIYVLYGDFDESNKTTEYNHYHNIAILIDFICADERYENIIEACDIISELPRDPLE